MKLIDALEILRQPSAATRLRVYLACGFTPLHLQTFLAAELRRNVPSQAVEVETGLFGDLLGNIARSERSATDVVATVVEWADLDPRLSLRNLGGWRPADIPDIVDSAAGQLARLSRTLRGLSQSRPVVCCLPTLPLPPVFPPSPDESSTHEHRLRAMIGSFAAEITGEAGVRVLSAQSLDERSAPARRLEVKSELTTGFPYTLEHASAVAESLAALIEHPPPKKGLITDLDDTLWAGLLGEVGVEGVCWTLELEAQEHGLYQQLLASLAASGVLIGVASKNDASLVDEAFGRSDFLLPGDAVFPVEVNWGAKSASIGRILEAWNIAPDSVVFVDDSPFEAAEVKAAFPDLECIVFPRGDHREFWEFMRRLRRLFGKRAISDEDALRMASIRTAHAMRGEPVASDGYSDEFLQSAEGSLEFEALTAPDARALELINKTNQFNLNGRRLKETAFRGFLAQPSTFLVTASYKDRFGPLGKIASVLGRHDGRTLFVARWVMSCRAFSRRIEHHCLAYLFEKFGADRVVLEYEQTPRNSVFQEFLASVNGTASAAADPEITHEVFRDRCPALVHRVTERADA
jgi:FkbH-like protein